MNFVAGLYYVLDHFPSRINVGNIDYTKNYMALLGHIIFSGHYTEDKLYNNIKEHFTSLDEYMDQSVRDQLTELGYNTENFFDLLAVVVKRFNDWIINGNETIASLYNKELSVLYHVLFPITSGLFSFSFKLNKAATRKTIRKRHL